jgi:hypothetical protein
LATDSKPTFDTNIKRAEYFLDIHEKAQSGRGAPPLPYRELPRGAVVFAVGALDAYISEVSAEVIVSQLQNSMANSDQREVLKRVQSEIPTLSLELALLEKKEERIGRIQESITNHFLNNVSNHGSKAVAAVLQRFEAKPRDCWQDLSNQGFKNPAAELDKWTNIRHEIVHEGKKAVVRRDQARKFIELARAVVKRIDDYAVKAK